ncbi:MAG: 30S ribosomal protein S1 [Ignavibacteriales bacterium]|nr:MAG: 30S ribosomal protein S1 [Ignavibacteriaceae bacterium]MBW7872019.1 30S ribosomal protein S1 [Ignavibacteria bacterium]MCZ2144115.1 30S ribosomal protein S1 [Ignavibacteriales bacterium]OQY72588.1 MAG: 30S ribosomal protein S1 [Ignavibacteriales bacterium UTCHB3]MBV6446084.1 30S ribosomal protein S1 [Ignavibacteriaceae bacterium]
MSDEMKTENTDFEVLYKKSQKYFYDEEYSQEEFTKLASLFGDSFRNVKEKEMVKGKIVRIQPDYVIVDVGFKSEGQIPISEFEGMTDLTLGTEVEVVLESVEDQEGNLVLSKKRADFLRVWEKVIAAHDSGEVIKGTITRRIKGGMVVDLMGMDAFLPGSQIDVRPIRDFDAFVGQEMDFKVVKVNIPTENVVVSHKVLVEEELADQRFAILHSLEKGQILEGIVKAVTDFGVFVDLGGVDGLIHITDLSWGRINHPNEVVKLDEKIKVVVTDFDEEKRRISLSLKKLLPHPWENIEQKYEIGKKVSGRVVSLTEYGAFIEIEKGIEGLIHNSEMSWTQHIKHPSQMVSMGQVVEAVILSLDSDEKKISLGMKQLEPDPWHELMEKYPIGSKHSGIVRNLTNFGVFVEMEPGIDGLIHISDLSWTKKIRHPGEVVKKGEKIDVIVLSVDTEQRKISLGHKQITDNPWDTFESLYGNGTDTKGKVSRLIEKGIIVELVEGVDAFVPTSQLTPGKLKNPGNHFAIDQELDLKVIDFDKENKKIVLSAVAFLKDKSEDDINEYISTHKLEKVTVQDFQNAETTKVENLDFPTFEVSPAAGKPKKGGESAG